MPHHAPSSEIIAIEHVDAREAAADIARAFELALGAAQGGEHLGVPTPAMATAGRVVATVEVGGGDA